ncbi:TPA: hypothetical protein ACPVZG_000130 [Vibrio parahaemolyticus]|nr:hypothetical protein [Vibrio parahaemolyticus]
MGKTIRLKMSGPSSVTVEPEKRSNRDKKKKKKENSQQNRSKEKNKLSVALSAGQVDDLPAPVQKHTIIPNRPKRVRDH